MLKLLGAGAVTPPGSGTLHTRAQVDTPRLTPTHIHPRKDIHTETTMSRPNTFSLLSPTPTLAGASGTGHLWAEWEEVARDSLSLRTPLPPVPSSIKI